MDVKKIIKICEGKLLGGNENVFCQTFTKDTRELKENDTYIGIKGLNFDGNSFYEEAFNKGANCVILEQEYVKNHNINIGNKPIIVVENALLALKKMAEYKRNNSSAKFVGITGSVGKTSTKDMIYSVLKEEFKALKTEGNLNNNIGLPLTLLRLTDEQAAVIEMGMNHLGEIDYLTKIARPNISVITNIGTAHIGEVGSRENILKAKLEILNGMDQEGILVINNDNDLLHQYYESSDKKKIVTIGIDQKSDFMATDLNLEKEYSTFKINYQNESYDIYCPTPGRVFVYNSLIAFAVGSLLNIPKTKIIAGIKNFELTKNRLDYLKIDDNITLINDAYNASVDSMKSSLEVLSKYQNRKIAVLGDMLELGNYTQKLHEEVGKYVVSNQIDILITVGKSAKYIAKKATDLGMPQAKIYSCLTNEEATSKIKEILKAGDVVLFKASNGMKLNEIIKNLTKSIE